MKNLSIIIPTLNEEKNVLPLFEKISTAMAAAAIDAEIIIVDDGSTDGTRQTVMDYTGRMNVRLICRNNERGLASAVVAGARVASSEIIVVMDADLSHPPEVIPSLAAPLFADTHDMVIGSRYVDGGETPDWPMIRKIGSRIASIPAQFLTSVHDPLAGFFCRSPKFADVRQRGFCRV